MNYYESDSPPAGVAEGESLTVEQAIANLHSQDYSLRYYAAWWVGRFRVKEPAAIAALIAARRTDIASLRTVAGDLNHQTLSEYHKTTPITDSLNPTDAIASLTKIPQCHFSGGKDKIVPPFVASEFVGSINQAKFGCAKQIILPDNTHHQSWEKQWPTLLKEPLICTPKN